MDYQWYETLKENDLKSDDIDHLKCSVLIYLCHMTVSLILDMDR